MIGRTIIKSLLLLIITVIQDCTTSFHLLISKVIFRNWKFRFENSRKFRFENFRKFRLQSDPRDMRPDNIKLFPSSYLSFKHRQKWIFSNKNVYIRPKNQFSPMILEKFIDFYWFSLIFIDFHWFLSRYQYVFLSVRVTLRPKKYSLTTKY